MFDILCLYFNYVYSVFSVFITLDVNHNSFAVNLNFGSRSEGVSGILNSSMCAKLEIPLANTGGVLDYVFTPELSNFDLHIILYIAQKLYRIEWLISTGWGHLNSYLARGGGNLNTNFPKIQMPGGLSGGLLKLRFHWYIIKLCNYLRHVL